ncbi:MAG: hypothetical protein WD737_04405 [Gemmatimonadota bacterium]
MRYLRPAAVGLAAALLPLSLSAQTIPSPFRFIETKHAIGTYFGHLQTDPGELDLGPNPAPLIGAKYSLHFTGPLSGTVALGVSATDRTLYARGTETDAPLVSLGSTDMFLMLGEAGMRFQFTGPRAWRRIAPFATATAGFATNLLTGSDEREEAIPAEQHFSFGPGLAGGIGLGSDFFLSERVSLHTEFRDYLWRLTTPLGLSETGSRQGDWTHNFSLTLGGAIHF